MCELNTGLLIASTLLTGAGQVSGGNADAAARQYNANVAEMNATLAERSRRDALERGKIEEQRKRRDVANLKGRQIVAFSEGNIDTSFGSPLDTIVDTAALGELDALTIRTNAAREAYDQEVSAQNSRSEAALNRSAASSSRTGSILSAGGTILGGGAEAYRDYRKPRIGSFS